MFKHIFIKRLRYYIRVKEFVFWLLIFPIILSTLFRLAFSNLLNGEAFDVIPIAIVNDEKFQEEDVLQQILSEISVVKGEAESKDTIFEVQYVSREKANELLLDDMVKGFVYIDQGTNLVIKENGTYQTIMKEVFDYIKRQTATITQIYEANQGNVNSDFLEELSNTKEYVKAIQVSGQSPNLIVTFFYTVLAMAALYGSMIGVYEVILIQADLSTIAMRQSLAPVSKLKSFFASFMAACLTQTVIMMMVLAYIMFVLKIDFGMRYSYIILTTIVGSITGITIGAFISSLLKISENMKVAIVVAFTMVCSFLAGMMDSSIKYKVMANAPLIDRFNPANLITDSYYKLYYYDDLSKYWENIIILVIMAILCFLGTVLILRRQKYESV